MPISMAIMIVNRSRMRDVRESERELGGHDIAIGCQRSPLISAASSTVTDCRFTTSAMATMLEFQIGVTATPPALVTGQAHHRAAMNIVLRQAGVKPFMEE
jgi:hypothetical protein